MRRPYSLRRARRRRRLWALSGVLVVVALLALGAAAVMRGRALAGALLDTFINRAGITSYSFEVRSVGWGGMRLGAVALGEGGALSASSVAIDWTFWSLLRRRLARVEIEGLRVALVLKNGALAVEGLPRAEGPAGGFVLPAERLALSGAHVAFSASNAKVTAAFDAKLAQAGDREIAGETRFDAILTPAGVAPIHILGDLPEWRLGDGEVHLANAEIALPERGTHLSGLALDARIASGAAPLAVSGKLSGELSDQSKPALSKPLALAFEVKDGAPGLALTGSAKTAADALVLRLEGRQDFARAEGALAIRSAPIRFAHDGRQPADLFPILGDTVKSVDGTVDASLRLAWQSGHDLVSALDLGLDGVGFEAGAAVISNLSGKIALDSILPPRMAAPQCVTAALQFAALPSGPLDLCFRLSGGDRLLVDRATLGFAGGKLALAGVSFAPNTPLDTALKVQDVDLGAVLALLGIDGLSGSGTLSGNIPLHLDASGMAIAEGRLAAAGPGILRYVGAGLPTDLGAGQARAAETVKLLRDALADFHYTSLMLTLDRAANGHGSLLANIKGANPAVLDGRLFALNIRFEADFDRLAALLLGGYSAGQDLLRRAAGQ
jgi:Dicarboxylate transport